MMNTRWMRSGLALIAALLMGVAAARTDEAPAKFQDTFKVDKAKLADKGAFPKGEIQKLDVDEENGVTVYDIEFKNGAAEQETDIAPDGTILEVTLVVDAKAVPAAAMKAIEKAAAGAKITRIESIDIRYETRDGKAIKLIKPVTHFAAEFTKGGKKTEVVVTPDRAPVRE